MLSTRPLPVWPPSARVPELAPWAVKELGSSQKGKKGSESQAAPQPSERERRLAERPESPLSTGTSSPFARVCPASVLCCSIADFVHVLSVRFGPELLQLCKKGNPRPAL